MDIQILLESEYLRPLLVIVIGTLALLFVNIFLKRRTSTLEGKKQQGVRMPHLNFLRFFQRIAVPLTFLGLLTIATEMISFNEKIQNIVKTGLSIVMTIIIRSLNKSLELAFSRYFEYEGTDDTREKNLRPLISLFKFILWTLGIIFLLANLGLDVSTAIAGLGVGGIAVAIAAKVFLETCSATLSSSSTSRLSWGISSSSETNQALSNVSGSNQSASGCCPESFLSSPTPT
ncbi:MAG: mechanosensitive ion channel [Sphaerochaeta sp.]|nr:mechanosensitive ion channel [Sphaerochaeta sp.]